MTSFFLRLAPLLLLTTLPLSAQVAETSYRVVYTGGTLERVPLGTPVCLYLDATLLRLVDDHLDALVIPVTAITGVSQAPEQRTPLASLVSLGHARRHTLAITWSFGTQRGGMALHCSAAEYQGILAALRGITWQETATGR